MKTAAVLVLIEGWGLGSKGQENPLYAAHPTHMNALLASGGSLVLHAAGLPIGLNWETTGGAEFGTATIGAGRTLDPKSVAVREPIAGTIGETVATAGLHQLRIAETLAYPLVTEVLDGFRTEAFPGEFRIHIPSEKFARITEHPELAAKAVTDRLIMSLRENAFDFIVVGYPNLDAMARAGSHGATVRAVEIMDRELGRALEAAAEGGHTMFITSSHGNAEQVMNPQTGEPDTADNPNPVPFIAVGPGLGAGGRRDTESPDGTLADVAPTILEFLGVRPPAEMTGESLLDRLR